MIINLGELVDLVPDPSACDPARRRDILLSFQVLCAFVEQLADLGFDLCQNDLCLDRVV